MRTLQDTEDHLEHIGVLGMHWGVHKRSDTSSSSSSKHPASADHERVAAIKKKKLSEMSNIEIKDLNARIRLEADYRSLNQTNVDRAKKALTEIIGNSVKSAAQTQLTAVLNREGAKLISEETKKTVEKAAVQGSKKIVEEGSKKIAENATKKVALSANSKLLNKAGDAAAREAALRIRKKVQADSQKAAIDAADKAYEMAVKSARENIAKNMAAREAARAQLVKITQEAITKTAEREASEATQKAGETFAQQALQNIGTHILEDYSI